jgi:hypothetical protein
MGRLLFHPSMPPPERLVRTVFALCAREGLDAAETTAVLAVALTWAPGPPRDPTPLLRSYTMTV